MELLAGMSLGIVAGLTTFLILFALFRNDRRAVSELVSGVHGEERLRTLEQGMHERLREVRESVHHVVGVVEGIDRARGESIAQLSGALQESRRTMEALQGSTARLAETLSSNQARGQWGERLAEDILRAAGFVEGLNYARNRQREGGATRPDFSFVLPEQRVLHMDVKFPIASYVRALGLPPGVERAAAERQFLADVRQAVRSVAGRDYIDPASGTLDFVLVFIPNEQIAGFVHEHDPALIDEALERGVVLCSPLMLYAMLAVIRRAADSFSLGRAADEILRAIGGFNQQWERYREAMESLGRRIESLQRAFDELAGTRTRMLDRRLAEIERLRIERGLGVPGPAAVVADEAGERHAIGARSDRSDG